MSLFYVRNIQLSTAAAEDKSVTSAGAVNSVCVIDKDVAICDVPNWVVEPRPSENGSTDELISPAKPKLLPQITAALLASWVSLASGASLGFVTPALPLLQHPSSHLQVTEGEVSWMAGLTMLGALLGGACSGPCVALGRRNALWLCAAPLALAWTMLATAEAVWMLYASHLVFGACMGVLTDAAQLYVSETAHPQWRGALGCVPVLMFNAGILACYAAGLFLPAWHLIAWFGAGLTIPALVLPAFLPESPSYLASRRRGAEALSSLRRLRGSAWDCGPELEELLSCETPRPGLRARLSALKDRSALRPLGLVAAIRLLSRFCGLRAILAYTQHILLTSRSSLDSGVATLMTGAVQWLATFVACVLVDRLGRRWLLLSSQMVMSGSLLALATYLYLQPEAAGTEAHPTLGWLPLVCIAVFVVANSIGLGPLSGLVLGELVPQRHRSIASSLTGALSWLAAFVVTKTFFDLQQSLHLWGTLYLYAAVCAIGVIFVAIYLPETRGMSQLEIESLFSPVKKLPTTELSSDTVVESPSVIR